MKNGIYGISILILSSSFVGNNYLLFLSLPYLIVLYIEQLLSEKSNKNIIFSTLYAVIYLLIIISAYLPDLFYMLDY